MDVFNPPPPGTTTHPGDSGGGSGGRKRGRPPGARDKQPRKRRAPTKKENAGGDGGDEELERLAAEIPEQKLASRRDEKPKMQAGRNLLICSMSGGGKSTVLMNIDWQAEYDNVFVVTLTKHTGSPVLGLASSEDFVLEGIDEAFLEGIIEFHKENRKARTAIIFDDRVGLNFDFKNSMSYKRLCTQSRHFRVTIVDSCQDIAEVPKLYRRNSHYLCFGPNFDANNDMIADQLSFPGLEKPKFRWLLRKITKEAKEKHEWMVYSSKEGDWWIWKPDHVRELDTENEESSSEDEEEEDEGEEEGERKIGVRTIPVSAFKPTAGDRLAQQLANEKRT